MNMKPTDIQVSEVRLPSGSLLHFFVNKTSGLVVVDIMDEKQTGGNEIFRKYMNERELLQHLDTAADLPERVPEDWILIPGQHRLQQYRLSHGLKMPEEIRNDRGLYTEQERGKPAGYFLESINSFIVEDDFEQGESTTGDTGCGLPHTPIAKHFMTKEAMLEWISRTYGYTGFEEVIQETPILEMITSKQVADHGDQQNGGWMEPTPDEIALWKERKLQLFNENVTILYHLIQDERRQNETDKESNY